MALSGENYWYYVYGEGNKTKVRLEISKDLTIEDFKYWREKLIELLNEADWQRIVEGERV